MRALLLLACLAASAVAAPAARATTPVGPPAEKASRVSFGFGGRFDTFFLLRSDSDFDPTRRYYEPDGQTEAQLATFARPDLRLDLGRSVTLFYEMELGWNVWGENDPDQWFPGDPSYPIAKHRELWAEWRPDRDVEVRVGYQHIADPSQLLLSHWVGALRVKYGTGESNLRFVFGQLPDDTYEGIDVRDNNFVHDSFFGLLRAQFMPGDGLIVDAGIYGLGDGRVVGRPLWLGAVQLGFRWRQGGQAAWAHVISQIGGWRGSGAGGVDQRIVAWAGQAGFKQSIGGLHWSVNGIVLSGDDDHDGNELLGAFFASGKNLSPTTYLTEDEARDRYDNLDERLARPWGAFFVNRAGLAVADASVGLEVEDWYHPVLVVGAGFAMNPHNALGSSFVGVEADLLNRFPLGDGASLLLTGQLFVPGKAAAALVNDTDRQATRPVYGGQLGFSALF